MCNICCEQQADFLFFLYQFVGNVHGDEPVGRELLLRLANWICDNYIKDSLVFLFIHYMSASKVFELYFAVYLLLLLFFLSTFFSCIFILWFLSTSSRSLLHLWIFNRLFVSSSSSNPIFFSKSSQILLPLRKAKNYSIAHLWPFLSHYMNICLQIFIFICLISLFQKLS